MATTRSTDVTWTALEHHHVEKGGDWYLALGIIAIAGAAAAVVFENALFGFVILLGATAMALVSMHKPEMVTYTITPRGVRIGDELFPYNELESFHIHEEDPRGAQLLLLSKRLLMPLIVISMPDDIIDKVERALEERLPEAHLEESFGHKILEFFGF